MLTWREFAALKKVWRLHREYTEHQPAWMLAMMANRWRDRDQHPQPYTIAEFMPSRRTKEDDEFKPVSQTVEQQMILMRMMLSAAGKADKKRAKKKAATNG